MAQAATFKGKVQRRLAERRSQVDGRAQLSLVEHALAPLNQLERVKGFTHRVSYPVFARKKAVTANVTVSCPFGLTPSDELFLWGLLSLTLADPDPSATFYATRYYVLRSLGFQDSGTEYEAFDRACRRLEFVTYENTAFYDPVRGELRDVRFGFLKRSKPLSEESMRGDRYVWDSQFFEFARHAYGGMRFPFALYRSLTPGARRLYLLTRKFFYRREETPAFDAHELAVQKLGLNPSMRTTDLRKCINHFAAELSDAGVIELPKGTLSLQDSWTKRGKGHYTIVFRRGPNGCTAGGRTSVEDSSLFTSLASLGVSKPAIRRLIATVPGDLLREWTDITLAAQERSLIRKTPAAYFIENVQAASKQMRTPPDWWRALRKQEDQKEWDEAGKVLRAHIKEQSVPAPLSFEEFLRTQEAQAMFERVCHDVLDHADRETAERLATAHLKNVYRRQQPRVADGPQHIREIAEG